MKTRNKNPQIGDFIVIWCAVIIVVFVVRFFVSGNRMKYDAGGLKMANPDMFRRLP